jgi:uracil-DNA glycosylase
MNVRIEESWKQVLLPEFDKPYFELLTQYVRQQYKTSRCFPPAGLIFNAFDSCPFDKVRVVIIGQDPYHEEGQAMGLSFSVPEGVQIPPSLVNIYKEIHRDLGTPIPASGDLRRWAEQGVLLLNATLTVEAHKAGGHQGKGWEELTDAAIDALNQRREHLVFMLWGSYAQRKGQFIDRRKHLVLQTSHPSPLSVYRGFDGCGHFSAANNYLIKNCLKPIKW